MVLLAAQVVVVPAAVDVVVTLVAPQLVGSVVAPKHVVPIVAGERVVADVSIEVVVVIVPPHLVITHPAHNVEYSAQLVISHITAGGMAKVSKEIRYPQIDRHWKGGVYVGCGRHSKTRAVVSRIHGQQQV